MFYILSAFGQYFYFTPYPSPDGAIWQNGEITVWIGECEARGGGAPSQCVSTIHIYL